MLFKIKQQCQITTLQRRCHVFLDKGPDSCDKPGADLDQILEINRTKRCSLKYLLKRTLQGWAILLFILKSQQFAVPSVVNVNIPEILDILRIS